MAIEKDKQPKPWDVLQLELKIRNLIFATYYLQRDLDVALRELQTLKEPAPSLPGQQDKKQGKNQGEGSPPFNPQKP